MRDNTRLISTLPALSELANSVESGWDHDEVEQLEELLNKLSDISSEAYKEDKVTLGASAYRLQGVLSELLETTREDRDGPNS